MHRSPCHSGPHHAPARSPLPPSRGEGRAGGGTVDRRSLRGPASPRAGRHAFTLVELLVVITILLVLTTLVITAFRPNPEAKMRDAARSAQSAFLGARDRALHAGDRRGIRLIYDPNDVNVCTGFVYLKPLDKLTFGAPNFTVAVCRPSLSGIYFPERGDATADTPNLVVFNEPDASLIEQLDQSGLIPSWTRVTVRDGTGTPYTYSIFQQNAPYYSIRSGSFVSLRLTQNVSTLVAMPGVQAIPAANCSVELDLGNEMLPQHTPINLPSGIVIDMTPGVSSAIARLDMMFSARGSMVGSIAAGGPIYLVLRDIQDITQGVTVGSPQERVAPLVLTIQPQTGHVQTYPIDPTDADGNGALDNPFRFAQMGSKAGG